MIRRDLDTVAAGAYDLAIVGGGIYGVSLLLEAAASGLRACLFERADFGGATSWNSLRIVHGGLRYLQSADLPRFISSVRARREFALNVPELVEPLPCLMPLYGEGLKRPIVLRAALALNDTLSWRRNAGVHESARVGPGQVLDPQGTRAAFAGVRRPGLVGAACWQDLRMRSSERVLIEFLLAACAAGGRAANYAEVIALLRRGRAVNGVVVRDAESGRTHEIRAQVVVNCAGPFAPAVCAGLDKPRPEVFRPSIAFNLLLDLALPTRHALAVAPPRAGAPVYFLVPQGPTTLAGTVHRARPVGTVAADVTSEEIAEFVADLAAALPGTHVDADAVIRVFSGLLPAAASGSAELSTSVEFVDHGDGGGPEGLYTVVGVKFTTARVVARQTLRRIARRSRLAPVGELPPVHVRPRRDTGLLTDADAFLAAPDELAAAAVADCVRTEAVRSVDDLLLRRTAWATNTRDLAPLEQRVRKFCRELPC